jgi:hypothetical protein
MATHYGASLVLTPGKPLNPAPPRTAMMTVAMTSTATAVYNAILPNTVTGAQIRAFLPPQRRAVTDKST